MVRGRLYVGWCNQERNKWRDVFHKGYVSQPSNFCPNALTLPLLHVFHKLQKKILLHNDIFNPMFQKRLHAYLAQMALWVPHLCVSL